jgi:hypothetical protein
MVISAIKILIKDLSIRELELQVVKFSGRVGKKLGVVGIVNYVMEENKMVRIKFGEEFFPQSFKSVRSANIFKNKMMNFILKDVLNPSREYKMGIANKLQIVEEPCRLRKGGVQSFG